MGTHKTITKIRPKIEAIATAFIVIVLIFFSTYLLYLKSIEALKEEIKIGLKSNVAAAATTIDGRIHRQFTRNTERSDSLFIAHNEPLERIRKAARNIRYIYTTILKEEKVYFVLNPSPQNDNDKDGFPDEAPALMDEYNNPAPELLSALTKQETIVSNPYQDEWGVFISGYAPFYDNKGDFVGVLGMDLELSNFYTRLAPIKIAFEKTAVIILFIGLVMGLLILYIRKHTQSVIKNNSTRVEQVIKLKQHIEETNIERIAILEKINRAILYKLKVRDYSHKQLYDWITHIIHYRESINKEKNTVKVHQNWDLDDLFYSLILQAQEARIILFIDQETKIPSKVYGKPIVFYKEMIAKLIVFVAEKTNVDNVKMTVKMEEEQLTHFKLKCIIEGGFNYDFERQFYKHSNPRVENNLIDYHEFDFVTGINQLRRYAITIDSFMSSTAAGIYMIMDLEKYKE